MPVLSSVLCPFQRGTYFGKRMLTMALVKATVGAEVYWSSRLTLTMMVASLSGRYHIALLKPG
jgi:hypothetical protein